MASDVLLDPEEAAEQRFWRRVRRIMLVLLILAAAAGILWALTAVLGAERSPALVLLGLLAGSAVAVPALASRRMRAIAGLVIGGIVLPLLAAHLGDLAAMDPAAFRTAAGGLLQFLIAASVALFAALVISPVRSPPAPANDGAVTPSTASVAGAPNAGATP